jgi:hypothetical protein
MKKLLYLAALFSFSAHAQNWQLIDDPEALAEINYYIDQPDPFGCEKSDGWLVLSSTYDVNKYDRAR